MKKEEKELLRKDLCARLPYSVKVCMKLPNHQEKIFEPHIGDLMELTKFGGYLVNLEGIDYRSFDLDIKPYLRPMSSMTEEEIKELSKIDQKRIIFSARHLTWHLDGEIIDYLNEKMLDWRGLISKGLALEAKEGMYNTRQKWTPLRSGLKENEDGQIVGGVKL